jgi:pimeloyl-ACP methyl ester carboxylesterase
MNVNSIPKRLFKRTTKLIVFALAITVLQACKKESANPLGSEWQGSGVENFSDYEPQANKRIRLFYYVPQGATATMPIVFVFHGAERDAMGYRNAIVSKANEHRFIAIVPEFSELNFPGGSGYQIGNVYIDGDVPTPATLNVEVQWSLSLVEPIFAFVKNKTKNNNEKYHIIGHSGGAQFAHRFLFFKPAARYDHVVLSAAGWYTATDMQTAFPYGFQTSPLQSLDLAPLFLKKIIVQVGTADNNPNSLSLRRNAQADLQGLHRLARAQYFYNKAQQKATALATPFAWELALIPGLDHSYEDAIGYSADLLFN